MEADDSELEGKFTVYERALKAYYDGDWNTARKEFSNCGIEAAQVFLDRIGDGNAPEDWSGIWTMQTK